MVQRNTTRMPQQGMTSDTPGSSISSCGAALVQRRQRNSPLYPVTDSLYMVRVRVSTGLFYRLRDLQGGICLSGLQMCM